MPKWIILLALLAVALTAETPLEYVSSDLWADMEELVADGDYLYAGFPYGVGVFDISDSSDVIMVEWYYIGSEVGGIVLEGDRLFAAAGDKGLVIMDKSDPMDLTEISRIDLSDEVVTVDMENDYAYVGGKSAGLHVVDVSSASSPTEVGMITVMGGCSDLTVEGDFIYLLRGLGGLSVVDVSTPSSPAFRGYYSATTYLRSIEKLGDHVFVAAEISGLIVLDVSDPDSPTPVSTYPAPTSGSINWLDLEGDVAYLGAGNYGVISLDVSDVSSMTPIDDRYPVSVTSVIRVESQGGILYISTPEGLQVADASTSPSTISFLSRENRHSGIESVWGSGSKMLTSAGLDGIDGFNLPTPETPNNTFRYSSGDRFNDAIYYAHYIFSAAGSEGLSVLRSGSLAEYPSPVTSITIGGNATKVTRSDTMCYIMTSSFVSQVNISDPGTPLIRWDAPTSDPGGMHASSDYLYVVDEDDGFLVFETTTMTEVGSDPGASGYDYTALTVYGDRAYASADEDGVIVFDVSDPTSPEEIGDYETTDDAEGIAAAEGWVYVAADRDGVIPFRITAEGDSLETYDGYPTGGRAKDIHAEDGYVYVADRYAVIVLRNNLSSIGEDNPLPEEFEISAHPNPFNGSCSVRLPGDFTGSTGVYSIVGREVDRIQIAKGLGRWTPPADMGSGLYFIVPPKHITTGPVSVFYLK